MIRKDPEGEREEQLTETKCARARTEVMLKRREWLASYTPLCAHPGCMAAMSSTTDSSVGRDPNAVLYLDKAVWLRFSS